MKLGKNRIHLLIMLFAVSSLLVHVPSNAYAADTWTAATTTNVGTNYMRGVSMSDASNGVAVGHTGTIVYTSDGGDTWTAATTTNVAGTHMEGVSMSDANNGVAVGHLGQIVYTSDGGDTWTAATTTNVGTNNMYGVSMGDANNGVAVGDSGQIVYTSDGGDTWTAATTTNVGTNYMRGVSMSDASNGVAVGRSGQIVYTSDGGDTWTAATTTNVGATHLYGVSMGDANNGVAVGDSGQIVYTSDGGDTWTAATTTNVAGTHMRGVSMSDASNGVAVGGTQIVYTSDGGDTWTAATTTNVGTTNMRGVSMSDASNGVAVGSNGKIVFTVTTSSGEESDSMCNDCTAPSLGISQNHKDPVRVIDDGITFNEKSFDVREFAQIYATIDTQTGVTNTIQLKIYEDSKPENVRKAILYLGLDSSDIYRNLACIIWETNSYGEKTITIIDKFDLFEDESATATIDGDILLLDYSFTSKIPIPTSTIAVELRDDKYNFGINYFENVIKVSGNPLQGTGTVSKNNSVQTLIVDTFQNESSDSQNNLTSSEFEYGTPFEIPSIMIADTSQWGFSDIMTQRYLADIEETIQQNDSMIQAMRNADVSMEIPIVEEELPRIEENLLQIEQQKAQLILNEILREDIQNWNKIYDPQTFEIDVKQLSALAGMSYDSLQPWMSNLETWVAEGTIDSSELVIAVEYLTNN